MMCLGFYCQTHPFWVGLSYFFFLNLNLIAALIIKAPTHLFPLSSGCNEESVEICSCSRFRGAPPLLWRVVRALV